MDSVCIWRTIALKRIEVISLENSDFTKFLNQFVENLLVFFFKGNINQDNDFFSLQRP